MFNYEKALAKLSSIGQKQLLQHWPELSEHERKHLLKQIEGLDNAVFLKQRKMLETGIVVPRGYLPFNDITNTTGDDEEIGTKAISEGSVGCIVVAGGQGTRLGLKGPKGAYPVTRFKKKSLFEILAGKVLAAGTLAGRTLPLAIMTSNQNHDETTAFFAKNHYFGLNQEQLFFFRQGELPLLDQEGNLFLDRFDSIAFGADGNGTCLKNFIESGLWNHWQAQGVRYINFTLIDNALSDPFDAELVGLQIRKTTDVTVKCIEKIDPEEKVGVLVNMKEKIVVVEYSELMDSERKQRRPDGALAYCYANISTFCFTMEFIKKAVDSPMPPMHLAHKAVNKIDEQGNAVASTSPNSWKFEYFIFDYLALADHVAVQLCNRDNCFAPLKNASGSHSLKSVQEALLKRELALLQQVSGLPQKYIQIELSQEFYYPTDKLSANWKGRILEHDGYIQPNLFEENKR